jgi:hypothetical protein
MEKGYTPTQWVVELAEFLPLFETLCDKKNYKSLAGIFLIFPSLSDITR